MILVVGATGLLGTRVCERLRAEGQPVRAFVRRTSNPDKVNALRSLGCELATGDLTRILHRFPVLSICPDDESCAAAEPD